MRKKIAMITATAAVVAGAALALASPGSAAVQFPSYYNSQAECESALTTAQAETGRNDLNCVATIGDTVPGPWLLRAGGSG
ncbi:hypothetical protein ACI2L1_36350 [Streptomyces sp. NPDC019531]|uniref:hypothetical protein n=1 Tax=Streptomyces sp. NPDC019531 TaxID=3365062 RepID=UPI00384BB594